MDQSGFEEAIKAARSSDIVLFFLGESATFTGEAKSRAFLNLPGSQEELFDAVAKTGKPVILIIMADRPLIFHQEAEKADAVLYAWHPGTIGGPAKVDLLWGAVSPSGKLTTTFPRAVSQVPLYYNHRNPGRSATETDDFENNKQDPEGSVSNYIDLDSRPEYPFGFGLSYTTFTYSDLELPKNSIHLKNTVVVSAVVKNTGKVNADEIVQLYIRDLSASLTRPVRELKGFERIHLMA